jgi:hypothetical protein
MSNWQLDLEGLELIEWNNNLSRYRYSPFMLFSCMRIRSGSSSCTAPVPLLLFGFGSVRGLCQIVNTYHTQFHNSHIKKSASMALFVRVYKYCSYDIIVTNHVCLGDCCSIANCYERTGPAGTSRVLI